MTEQSILDGKVPVECEDLFTWGRWLGTHDRHVAKDDVGECWVSTVFLGVNYNFSGRGAPLLFETMAFGPPESKVIFGKRRITRPDICSMARYCTWDEAAAGHARIVAEVQAYLVDTAVAAEEAIAAIAAKQSS